MKNEKIKNNTQVIYRKIEELELELNFIRNNCPHEKVSLTNYLWAPGHIEAVLICDYCGHVVRSATEKENVYLNGEGI